VNVLNAVKVFGVSIVLTFVVGVILLATLLPNVIAPNTVGANYKNVTVRTQVNITNSRPEVINVSIYELVNASNKNITLAAGGFKDVICNATLRDWNGFNDIIYANATLWNTAASTYNASDNNNTHYTNSNCTNTGNGAGYYVNYACNFTIIYYANNGTWNCNVTVMDNQSTTGVGNGTSVFYPVYALNVTDGIDFGNAAVQDFTGNVTANITNIGNMAINVTVEGYGANRGDGLAMSCGLGGNITVGNERFATANVDWSSKIPLSSSPQMLPNITMQKQINSTVLTNTTYWQLYIDSTNNPGGNCTGYVIFTAVAS
jgi:hypothetical protein